MNLYFQKFEQKALAFFEQFPFVHALLAAIAVILFWHGMWEIVDATKINFIWSAVLGLLLMVGTGLFVQMFIGDTILIKKVDKKTNKEIKDEVGLSMVQKEVSTEEMTLTQLDDRYQLLHLCQCFKYFGWTGRQLSLCCGRKFSDLYFGSRKSYQICDRRQYGGQPESGNYRHGNFSQSGIELSN
jgi:hypothetical protein